MSDRAATETKFTRLLIAEKANTLRKEDLSEGEIECCAKVYNFTCSLHKINNTTMTHVAEKHFKFDQIDTSGTCHIYIQTDMHREQ